MDVVSTVSGDLDVMFGYVLEAHEGGPCAVNFMSTLDVDARRQSCGIFEREFRGSCAL